MPMSASRFDGADAGAVCGWDAASASVRGDLADLPALSGRVLDVRLKGHIDRAGRLIARHEQHFVRAGSKTPEDDLCTAPFYPVP